MKKNNHTTTLLHEMLFTGLLIITFIANAMDSTPKIPQVYNPSHAQAPSLKDLCLIKLAQILSTSNPNSFDSSLIPTIKEEYRNNLPTVENKITPEPSDREILNTLGANLAILPIIDQAHVIKSCLGELNPTAKMPSLSTKLSEIVGQGLAYRIEPADAKLMKLNINKRTVSSDGKFMATQENNIITLWRITAGKYDQVPLTEHKYRIHSVTFSPDSKYMATRCYQKALLWNIEKDQPIQVPIINSSGAEAIVFSPDCKYMISQSHDRAIFWNITLHQPTHPVFIRKQASNLSDFFFSPQGKFIFDLNDKNVLWSLTNNTLSNSVTIPEIKGVIHSVIFSPNDEFMIANSADQFTLWNLKGNKPTLLSVPSSKKPFHKVSFSPQGRYLKVKFVGKVILLDLATGQPIKVNFPEPVGQPNGTLINPHKNVASWAIKFHPHEWLVSTQVGNKSYLWSIIAGHPRRICMIQHAKEIRSIAFSPCGHFLAANSPDKTLLWPLANGHLLNPLFLIANSNLVVRPKFHPHDTFIEIFERLPETVKHHLWNLAGKEPYPVQISDLKNIYSKKNDTFLETRTDSQISYWNLKPTLSFEQKIMLKQLVDAQLGIESCAQLGPEATALYQELPPEITKFYGFNVCFNPNLLGSAKTATEIVETD